MEIGHQNLVLHIGPSGDFCLLSAHFHKLVHMYSTNSLCCLAETASGNGKSEGSEGGWEGGW